MATEHGGETMHGGHRVGVVIPARNEHRFIQDVLERLPLFVDLAVVVDDGSTDGTAERARAAASTVNIEVIRLGGEGVGAAIDAGHRRLLEVWSEPFVSAVMAGDGQMDPDDLLRVIEPVTTGQADHVKGDRSSDGFRGMPANRRWATAVLSFFTTLACGQRIRDPQCGYTATHRRVLANWDWARSWRGYGYPNHWLIRLAGQGYRIAHVSVKSVYGDEVSGIVKRRFFLSVGWMMAVEHHRRNLQWLIPHRASWVSYLALTAYISGWFAWATLPSAGWAASVVAVASWTTAHLFDRWAVVMRRKGARDEAI